jgi:hypothetical protein
MEKGYDVECRLDDNATPGAPHAYGPVMLTFKVRGRDVAHAVENTKIALKELSKVPSTIEKITIE